MDAVDLRQAVCASAAIPGVFTPVRLHDEHYVDGGVREVVPLTAALRAAPASQVTAVTCFAPQVRPAESFADRGLFEVLLRVPLEINIDELTVNDLRVSGDLDGRRVRVIAPTFDTHDPLALDPGLVAIDMDHGWLCAADAEHDAPPPVIATTRRLIELRLALWSLRARGPEPGAANIDADREAQLRRQLRVLLEQRASSGGDLPSGAHDWAEHIEAVGPPQGLAGRVRIPAELQ